MSLPTNPSPRAVTAALSAAPWNREVPETKELQRIVSIPRRDWSAADAESLAKEMTQLLKTEGGTMELRPFQAVALHDLCAYGGLVGMGRVGVGKTLCSLLAPYVCEAHRPLLMIPANLREKTLMDARMYRKHWEICTTMDVQSYETLARANHSHYLHLMQPDLIICAEAHHLKNTKAAVTRRLKRYLECCRSTEPAFALYPKNVKIMLLSGTLTNRSIREYWHLLKWTLPKELVPLPSDLAELEMWSLAIDERVKEGNRVRPGALKKLFSADEAKLATSDELAAVRRAYGRRLVSTPGVVSTVETFSGSRLEIRDIQVQPPKEVLSAFRMLRSDWQLPDGQPISDGMLAAKAAKELALGFFYRWDPRPPEPWLKARREWCQYVRRILARNKIGLDTEEQVKLAIQKKLYPSDLLNAWLAVKDTFEINVEPVWLSDFAVDAATAWARKAPGIVWVYHQAFAERLAKKSGLIYYGEGGFSKEGHFIERHPAKLSMIASITANRQGKNLQAFNRNLVCNPPSRGGWWEQLIGRTHRDGQTAECVTFDMFASCVEHYHAFHQALKDALYTQDSTPMAQKLLYADLDVKSLEDAESLDGAAWHPGKLKEDSEAKVQFFDDEEDDEE